MTLSRRAFLGGSAVLLLGFSLQRPVAAQVLPAPADPADLAKTLDQRQLDAWLAVDAQGQVTVYSGKVELGTGVSTALRQIVAEELCVAFAATRLIQGDTRLTPDQGITAGSKSLQVGGAQLRKAAASARQFLFLEGSRRLGLDLAVVDTVEGRVVYRGDPTGRSVSYGELVGGRSLGRLVNQAVRTRAVKDYRLVGTSVPREDIPAKLFGSFDYVHDLRLPGMLHGCMVRPPCTGSARLAGVSLRGIDASALPAGAQLVYEGAFVAVVAEQPWLARQGAAALRVDWSLVPDLPLPGELYARLEAKAGPADIQQEVGDVEGELANAAQRLDAEYRWPYQNHDSIGPSCAVADVRADGATVWSGTQGVYQLRAALADLLALPEDSIHVIYQQASGCYGHNGADDAAADAALLSRLCGRPVRVQWSRADEHGWNPKGPAMLMRLAGGLGAAGDLLAWRFANWTPTHLTRPNGQTGKAALLAGQLAYNLPLKGGRGGGNRNAPLDYDLLNVQVATHWLEAGDSPLRPSALRALGAVGNTFANESFMDELALAAGVDPLEFRLRYLQDPRARAVLQAATARAGWQPPARQEKVWDGALAKGQGLAFLRYENENAYVAVVVEVAVSEATGIRVTRVVVAHDCGLIVNPDGLRNQLEGCVVQGIARTLKQAVRFDHQGVTSLEWGAYPPLTFNELPELELELIDRPEEPAVGAGEATTAAIPAAIANAVAAATGLRLREVPLNRQRLREALAARR